MTLAFNYHPALLENHRILRDLQVLVNNVTFTTIAIVSFRRPRKITKDNLIRARLKPEVKSVS